MDATERQSYTTGSMPGYAFRARWWVIVLCCMLSWGCALRPLPRDLATYVNRDIYGIAELENIALRHYAQQTGPQYRSDDALRSALNITIIPAYSRFAKLAGKISPETPAVRELHALYRDATVMRLHGFRTVFLAIDSQDPDLVHQANRMLDRGQELFKHWQESLAAMAQQHRLNLQ